MNELSNNSKRYLEVGLEVTYIGGDKKSHKAKIIEVYNQNAARIESLDGKNSAIATYSDSGEVNTFSFPSSATASAEPENQ